MQLQGKRIAILAEELLVRDGTLITSRMPDDLPAFCSTILEALAEAPVLSAAR